MYIRSTSTVSPVDSACQFIRAINSAATNEPYAAATCTDRLLATQ